MATWVVTRHSGARSWLSARGIIADRIIAHLDISDVLPGDTVVGTLPIQLVADIYALGAKYLHLKLTIPHEMRGIELTSEQMEQCDASLEEYRVERVQ